MSFSFQTVKHTQSSSVPQQKGSIQSSKTRLTKKYTLNGFQLSDLVWMRPSEGKHKYEILVRYIDPEQNKTKRQDGSYQKIIKFGQKGVNDYVDIPYLASTRDKVLNRLKVNCDNPLHANFYVKNILNGQSQDPFENFRILKRQIFV